MSAKTSWTPGPWEVDTIKSDGEYGDGGPDSRSGYDAYAVFDAQGRALFDSLNRDSRVSEIHEDGPDEDGRGAAWDEFARRDLTLAAAAPEMADLVLLLLADIRANLDTSMPLRAATLAMADKVMAKARGES